MFVVDLRDSLSEVLKSKTAARDTKRLAYQLGDLLEAVEEVAVHHDTPFGTQRKATAFLKLIAVKHSELGSLFFQEAYMLNVIGEAMVRERYLAEPVLEFLRTGLYFYGLNHIERFHRAQGMPYMVAHAELLGEFCSRKQMKANVKQGQERLDESRPFCIVHVYLSELRKKYWAGRRQADDACDHSFNLEELSLDAQIETAELTHTPEPMVVEEPEVKTRANSTAEDRVSLMLRLFAEKLSPEQRRIYLRRHPLARTQFSFHLSADAEMKALLDDMKGQGSDKVSWALIAQECSSSEKSVKREYLRALHTLLAESAAAVFPQRIPSSLVRRVLASMEEIIGRRDLRIREQSGHGLAKVVERWEISLRFVLNHVSVASGEDGFSASS